MHLPENFTKIRDTIWQLQTQKFKLNCKVSGQQGMKRLFSYFFCGIFSDLGFYLWKTEERKKKKKFWSVKNAVNGKLHGITFYYELSHLSLIHISEPTRPY